MSNTHRALHIVLREHAGYLGSFTADQRARLHRTHEIMQECEDRAEIFMADAKWGDVATVRTETLARIHSFAPDLVAETYVSTYFKIQRLYKKRLKEDRRSEKRRQQGVRRKTH